MRRWVSCARFCVCTDKIRKWFVWFEIPMLIKIHTHILRGHFYWWEEKQFRCIFAGIAAALDCTICELDEFNMNLYATPKEKCDAADTLAHVHLWLLWPFQILLRALAIFVVVLFVFTPIIRLVLFWFVKIFGEQSIRQIFIRVKCLLFQLCLTKKKTRQIIADGV